MQVLLCRCPIARDMASGCAESGRRSRKRFHPTTASPSPTRSSSRSWSRQEALLGADVVGSSVRTFYAWQPPPHRHHACAPATTINVGGTPEPPRPAPARILHSGRRRARKHRSRNCCARGECRDQPASPGRPGAGRPDGRQPGSPWRRRTGTSTCRRSARVLGGYTPAAPGGRHRDVARLHATAASADHQNAAELPHARSLACWPGTTDARAHGARCFLFTRRQHHSRRPCGSGCARQIITDAGLSDLCFVQGMSSVIEHGARSRR